MDLTTKSQTLARHTRATNVPLLWSFAVLVFQLTAHCSSAADTQPLQTLDTSFRDAENLVCGQAISTGQQAGICGIVGSGCPMQSAAGLLSAARYQDFDLRAQALSSEPNVPGVMADVILEVSRSSTRCDEAKYISGSAQVDLFLCVDASCTVIGDLAYVLPESTAAAAGSAEEAASAAILAMGYLRMPLSSAGMPTRYVSSSSGYIRSQYLGKAALQSSRGDSKAMTASQVSWTTPDTAQYMYGNPVLMELGCMTRMLTLPVGAKQEDFNVDFNLLRMGNYRVVDEETGKAACATIISFKSRFMDGRGWGQSAACTPTRTYIFSSYMTEALLEWPYLRSEPYEDAGEYPAYPYVFNLRTATSAPETLYSAQDEQALVGNWGACMLCPEDMFRNVESAAVAGEHTCRARRHTVCDYDSSEQDTIAASMLALGAAGGAVIAAWDITEGLSGPDAQNRVFTESYTGDFGEGVQFRALRPLLALAAMATAPDSEGLPWCTYDLTDASSFRIARDGFALASAVPPAGGAPLLLADCGSWEALGLGSVWPEGQEPPSGEAVSGAAMLKLMTPTWVVMDGSADGAKWISGFGDIVFDTLRSGVDNVVAMAAVLLHEGVAAELAVTDAVLTPYGGLINIVLTFIAVLATHASRKDLVHVLGKAAPPRATRAAAAALSFFAIVTPAALLVVTQVGAAGANPDGGDSTMAWVRADALGQGDYRVVALVSTGGARRQPLELLDRHHQ